MKKTISSLTNKGVCWLFGIALAWGIERILDHFIPSLRLWERLKNTLRVIIAFRVPAIVILIVIAFMIGWLYSLNKKIRFLKLPDDERTDSRAVVKKLKEEHVTILLLLAEVPEELGREALYNFYQSAYPSNRRKDFKLTLVDLKRMRLIVWSRHITAGEFYSITEDGLLAIRELENRNSEAGGRAAPSA